MKPTPLLLTCLIGLAVPMVGLAQPTITVQPRSQTNVAGSTLTLSVEAAGAPPLMYQWRSHATASSFTNIPFGTEATLGLTNVQPTTRRFAVVVTDSGGLSVTSSPLVALTVLVPPAITTQPTNFPTMGLGASIGNRVLASGTTPLYYQWRLNETNLPGQINTSLVLTNLQLTNAGAYTAVVTNSVGSVTSVVVTLIVDPTAATTVLVTAQNFSFTPSAVTIRVGDAVFFNNAEGTHNVTGYNPVPPPERFCGTTLVGPGPLCTVTFTNAGVFQFRCVPHSTGSGTTYSGMIGSITVTSPAAPPLVVISNPVNNSLFASPAAIAVSGYATVIGATVTNIQLFANDALVGIGATSPFFVNASSLAAGDYRLTARARDTRGMNGTSAPVNIRVIDPPLLVTQPDTNGPIQFSFNTVTGLNYIVQASTDRFTNWSGLVTNRAATTHQAYVETFDAGSLRFYRVLVQP